MSYESDWFFELQVGSSFLSIADAARATVGESHGHRITLSRGETLEYVLANCPFADVGEADPDTVCGLHLGLAQGLADQLEGVAVDDLIRRNPHRAGCRLRFQLTPLNSETTSS
jgi:hypothetical protein